MREPNSRIAGADARPVFAPQQLLARFLGVLDEYSCYPLGHKHRSTLRDRLRQYKGLFEHIALGPVHKALSRYEGHSDETDGAMVEHRYFKRARRDACSRLTHLPWEGEFKFAQVTASDIFEPWLSLPMDYGLNVREFLSEPLNHDFDVSTLVLARRLPADDMGKLTTCDVEPVTRTILLRTALLHDESQWRDQLSLVVDLVMQKQYLAEFYASEGALQLGRVEASMRLIGLNLAIAAYQFMLNQCRMIKSEILADAMIIKVPPEQYHSACYLRYVVERLIIDPIDFIVSHASNEGVSEMRDEVISKYPNFYALRRCRILLLNPGEVERGRRDADTQPAMK